MIEATPYLGAVSELYTIYLNRPGEVAGLNYWQGYAVQVGGNMAELHRAFATSAEFQSLYAGHDAAAIVNRAHAFLFNHGADQASLQLWTSALNSGQLNVGTVVQAIAESAQGADLHSLQLKSGAGLMFSKEADKWEPYESYNGPVETQAARDWMAYIWDSNSYAISITTYGLYSTVRDIITLQNFSGASFDNKVSALVIDDLPTQFDIAGLEVRAHEQIIEVGQANWEPDSSGPVIELIGVAV